MSENDSLWVDESSRASAGGVVYVVAGVRLFGDKRSLNRLSDLRFPNQRYLHWRDEPGARRREFVAVTNEITFDVTIAVARDVPLRRQEHARSICLAGVIREGLQSPIPIVRASIEGRGLVLNRRDHFTVMDETRRLQHRPTPTIDFVSKSASPLLWVADAVASMASNHFADAPGSDYWWRSLRLTRLTILHIEP